MNAKPTLLFHCQHSVGIGHLTRSFALVRAMTADFHVVFLNGGPLPPGVAVPPGIEIVHLPPLGLDEGNALVSRDDAHDVAAARESRRTLILDTLARVRPDIVLVELFPFGRKKFAFELLPLVRAARTQGARVVCSLRDILVSGRRDQQRHDDRARWLANRYFDAVLIHSDPAFASLEESFRPSRPVRIPMHYTGFVVPDRSVSVMPPRQPRILVSAGGGIVGQPLYLAALGAQRRLWARWQLSMRVVAGPFLPEAHWVDLQAAAKDVPGVELVRHVADLTAEMREARVSVSQCGYNSALDIVQAGVAALVVPYGDAKENEQLDRAGRLARCGAVRMLEPASLDDARLAAEIEATLAFAPSPAAIDLAGAAHSAALLLGLAGGVAPLRSGARVEVAA